MKGSSAPTARRATSRARRAPRPAARARGGGRRGGGRRPLRPAGDDEDGREPVWDRDQVVADGGAEVGQRQAGEGRQVEPQQDEQRRRAEADQRPGQPGGGGGGAG